MKTISTQKRGAWLHTLAAILSLATFGSHTFADDFSVAQQFTNATTIIIAKIETKRLGLPVSTTKKLDTDREATSMIEVLQQFEKALNGESVFIAVDIPFSKEQSPVRLMVKNMPGLDKQTLLTHLERFQFSKPVVQGDYLCYSAFHSTESSSKIAIADNIIRSVRPDLESAMQEVRDYPIQVLILPPDYLWETVRDLMPTIPAKFGGGPSSLLTEGVRWTAVGFDPSKLSVQAITQSRSPAAANALATHLPKLMQSLANQFTLPAAKKGVEQMAAALKPVIKGDQITFSTIGLSASDANIISLTNAAQEIFGPLTTQIKLDRFKQIGLAIHNFENANKFLPPAKDARAADGKCILSWRVHILPYLGEVNLYNQFRLKEPWDSEHNLTLLDKMPDVYRGMSTGIIGSSGLKPGYTTFLAPVGDDTIFGGNKPVKFSDIKDGSSNTVWLVEVKPEFAKPWTAPEDFEFDAANPAAGLAEIAGEKPSFLAALGDGSVTRIPLSLPAKSIQHLFQKNDGNAVQW